MNGALIGALVALGAVVALGWVPRPARWQPAAARHAALAIALAALAALVTLAVTGLPAVAVIAAVLAAATTVSIPRRRRAQQARARSDAWPDAIDLIRSSVRTGSTLPEALATPAVSGPEALRPQFRGYRDELVKSGSLERALVALSGDPVGARISTVMRVSATVGSADVGRVLDALSSFLRADKARQQEIRARQSWNVAAARLAVAAPWITVAVIGGRAGARAAYATTAGWIVLMTVAVSSAAAYWMMLRVGDSPGRLL